MKEIKVLFLLFCQHSNLTNTHKKLEAQKTCAIIKYKDSDLNFQEIKHNFNNSQSSNVISKQKSYISTTGCIRWTVVNYNWLSFFM